MVSTIYQHESTIGIYMKEETDRTGSILKAGLHLGPDCRLWAICPVSLKTTYQPEKQAPGRKSPRALHRLKEYPNYLCNWICQASCCWKSHQRTTISQINLAVPRTNSFPNDADFFSYSSAYKKAHESAWWNVEDFTLILPFLSMWVMCQRPASLYWSILALTLKSRSSPSLYMYFLGKILMTFSLVSDTYLHNSLHNHVSFQYTDYFCI